MSYTKLHEEILYSSLWQHDNATRILWITLLAKADRYGEVMASVPGLAHLAVIGLEECESSLEKLLSPDPYSRTQDREGRRIEKIDGGWVILNYLKHRDNLSKNDQRAKAAERQRRLRERRREAKKQKESESVTKRDMSRNVTHTDADTDPYANTDLKTKANLESTDPTTKSPDPERDRACVGGGYGLQVFEKVEKPVRTGLEASADLLQEPLASKKDSEISSLSLAGLPENRQEAALIPSCDVTLVEEESNAFASVLSHDEREALIDEAIATYNRYRGAWGECKKLPGDYRNRLYQLYCKQEKGDRRTLFLELIKEATCYVANSAWFNKPEFENKNFLFLVGRKFGQDKFGEYSAIWQSLPDDQKIGLAIKLSQPPPKQYCDLRGKPCTIGTAFSLWQEFSSKAKAGNVSAIEQDWATLWFPDFDIYVGADELA